MRAPRVLPCAVDAPQSEGFVLVGVVIFVMALTILGLSVFSLSSYEAQFMRQAMQEQQVYNDAMSGFERAKFALTVPPYRLERVQTNLPAGVDSTIAWQAGNTAGPVQWSGASVMVRVRAHRGNSTQAYVAWFVPQMEEDQYKRLVTSSVGLVVEPFDIRYASPDDDRRLTVHLSGDVWENVHDDPIWRPYLGSFTGSVTYDSVSVPAVSDFIASKSALASLPVADLGSSPMTLAMRPPAGTIGYYVGPQLNWAYSFYDSLAAGNGQGLDLTVRGTVVWLLPRGIRMNGPLHVIGEGSNPTLVIVAGRNNRDNVFPYDYRNAGVYLLDFFHVDYLSNPVTLILVTDGVVYLQHVNSVDNNDSYAYNTSIVCAGLSLAGPHFYKEGVPVGKTMRLTYTSMVGDQIDYLQSQNALPLSGVVGTRFNMIAGTWQDKTP